MAFIWVVVTLGISTPLLVDTTSNCAEAAGVAVPMPTLWARAVIAQVNMAMASTPALWKDKNDMGLIFYNFMATYYFF
jgi:hypothetical protein